MTDAKPPRVLLLDDDVGKRYAIARQLQQAGFIVDEAETGAQALALVTPEHDVAILDLRLPDLDGFEVCRRIKAEQATSRVMVLELSATWASAQDRAKGLDLGADAYLAHPVESVELIATINALIRLRRAVHERDLERELFVAMVGHDLRNPLGAISTSIDLLRTGKSDEARQRDILDRAARSVQRMRRLIDQVLVFTQSLSDDLELHQEDLDLVALCREVVGELSATKVELIADGEVRVRGDHDRLSQVIENLVSNAIRHGAGTATVRVSAADSDHVEVSVHNPGTPIPAAAMPSLFEPYRRATTRPGGFGLGLFIVDRITRAHRGTVTVTSSEDHGTTFKVRLPRTS